MFMTALITSTWIGVTGDFPVEKQTIIHKADVSLYLFQGRPTTYHSWTLTFAQLTTAHLNCNILLISLTTIANCQIIANIYFALTFAQVTVSGIKESAINFHTLLNNCRKMANTRVLILPVLLISVLHTSELSLTMTSIQTMVRTDTVIAMVKIENCLDCFLGAGLECYSCPRGGQDCQNGWASIRILC